MREVVLSERAATVGTETSKSEWVGTSRGEERTITSEYGLEVIVKRLTESSYLWGVSYIVPILATQCNYPTIPVLHAMSLF
jgi:hypothetical protein